MAGRDSTTKLREPGQSMVKELYEIVRKMNDEGMLNRRKIEFGLDKVMLNISYLQLTFQEFRQVKPKYHSKCHLAYKIKQKVFITSTPDASSNEDDTLEMTEETLKSIDITSEDVDMNPAEARDSSQYELQASDISMTSSQRSITRSIKATCMLCGKYESGTTREPLVVAKMPNVTQAIICLEALNDEVRI